MTWQETHARTRIIREVEAAAAVDMTGALPWREEWVPFFGSPEGLLTGAPFPLEPDVRGPARRAHHRRGRLQRHPRPAPPYPGRHPRDPRKASETEVGAGAKVLALTGASMVPTPRKSRRYRGGPVISR